MAYVPNSKSSIDLTFPFAVRTSGDSRFIRFKLHTSQIPMREAASFTKARTKVSMQFRCENCGEVTQKETCVCLDETVPSAKGKSQIHLPQKCNFGCNGETNALVEKQLLPNDFDGYAGKFSNSKGIGVLGNDAKDTNIRVEVWRYYLLTNRPQVKIGMEYVDMYLVHVKLKPWACSARLNEQDFDKLDIVGTWAGMEKCLQMGLCRAVGVTESYSILMVLLICVTKVEKSAFDKALAEHEDIDDVVGSEEPTERDHGVDLQRPLLIKIDSSDSHQKRNLLLRMRINTGTQ
ncbi:hypothetical protein OROHE_001524 [Orobanche hederae]